MPAASRSIELSCPAKVNLSLAVLGRRDDGFHALHSIVSQLEFGDTLRTEWDPDGKVEDDQTGFHRHGTPGPGSQMEEIAERDNTVSKAIQLFREAAKLQEGSIQIQIEKRIPTGAGLGGGSSDAVAALKSIEMLLGDTSVGVDFPRLSSAIGSDCPLFYFDGPVVMEGRGELISELDETLAKRFRGKSMILFKPSYSINTGEAYRRMAAGKTYSNSGEVRKLMLDWESGDEALPPQWNDFERVCSLWIPDLAVVFRRLREIHGLDARLSGSGSACFLLTDNPEAEGRILEEELVRAWGDSHWMELSELK